MTLASWRASYLMSKYYIRRITDYKINHLLSAEVTLYRPRFVILKTLCFACAMLTCVFFASLASVAIEHNCQVEECSRYEFVLLAMFWSFFFTSLMSARFVMLLILIYQRFASASTRLRCRCVPSCSQYALIALKKYGISYGVYKMIFHLKICAVAPFYEFP